MDNLWKKETTQNCTRYVDLFASIHEDAQTAEKLKVGSETLESITSPKDNQKSTKMRMDGNEFFGTNDWFTAMHRYTRSLRMAEIGSENVALAYSNRSACFFHMRMYDEALIDIELAKKANLPDRLLPKLEQRRLKCLELVITVRRLQEYQPKLDYAANEHFPCLADVVEMQCNQEFGRHLVAKCDIPNGKTILLEENFAVTDEYDFSKCYTCFCQNANFIACEGCTKVVFCSLDCMNRNQTHAWECGTFFGHMFYPDDIKAQRGTNRTRLIMHTLLTAISTFSDIESLMQFVEKMLREDPDQLPSSLHDQISKYHFFFKLKKRMVNPLDDVKRVYKCFMILPKIRAVFDSEEKQCFLMHLIAHHSFVVEINSFGSDSGSSVQNVGSLLNHSCHPNISEQRFDKMTDHVTCRPIKKGEQLFISYLSPANMKLSKEQRQEKLKRTWGFNCTCKKCVSTDDSDEINTPPTLDPTTRMVLESLQEFCNIISKS